MENREKTVEKRKQQDYTMAFKLGIVSRVEKGEFTYKQAQKHYGIQGRSTVLVWLRKSGNLDWSKPTIHTMLQSKETPAENKIKPSMTDGYDCYQNALAERINGILKQEFLIYKCKNIQD